MSDVNDKPVMKRDVIYFADCDLHGAVDFPSPISASDYADFVEHLDLIKRKVGRSVLEKNDE